MEENKIINEEEIVAEVEDVIAEAAPEEAAPVEAAPEEAAPEEAAPEDAEKETVEDALDELQKAAETTVEELKSAAGVTFIRIRKNDTVVLNLPMTVGIIGTVLGLAAAPWAVILATITTIGLKCTVEVEKKDGSIILIHGNKQDK